MAENPFKGSWGYEEKPLQERDRGFIVEDIGSMTDVKIVHETSRPANTKSDGKTTALCITFRRKIPNADQTIVYTGMLVDPIDDFDGRIIGMADIVPDSEIAQDSECKREIDRNDPDWVGNRPA